MLPSDRMYTHSPSAPPPSLHDSFFFRLQERRKTENSLGHPRSWDICLVTAGTNKLHLDEKVELFTRRFTYFTPAAGT